MPAERSLHPFVKILNLDQKAFAEKKMEEDLKQAEYLAQQEAIKKAAEQSRQRQIEEAKRQIQICKSSVCTEDLCSDGKERRMINDDCCACPEDDEPLMFNPKGDSNTDESILQLDSQHSTESLRVE